MTTKMERIVRPFQTRDVTPGRLVSDAYERDTENVVLTFGQNGGGKTFGGSLSFTHTKYMDVKQKEKKPTQGLGIP